MNNYADTATKPPTGGPFEYVNDPVPDGASLIANVQSATITRQKIPRSAPAQLALPTAENAYRHWGKRVFDTVFVLISLPVTLPIVFLTAMTLALEGHSIFHRQRRVGRDGKNFQMLKFRTMVPDADQLLEDCLNSDPALRREWDRTQKLKRDPRITRLGGFLRRSSLDELPQLWNVLTGDMSLVGPRPMMPQQAEIYGDMRAYLWVRPGITGLWQVMERNESDFSSRCLADRKYVRQYSLEVDLKLIFKTLGVVLRGTGY